VTSEKEKIEYDQNVLLINHNYNLGSRAVFSCITILGSDQQIKKKFTLFLQPFIFDISYDQVNSNNGCLF